MKIIVADHSGFCFGVEKAMETAMRQAHEKKGEKIYTLGPLIHNQQAVNRLKSSGIETIEDIKDLEGEDKTVIIRSHGVPKKIYDMANEKGINLVDATCPFVKKIQNIVKEYREKGYNIIIIGDKNHPEVIGINGWCNNEAFVVNTREDVEKIPFIDNMCIVAQTTMPMALYLELVDMLQQRANNVIQFNTICFATKDRQESAKKLAGEVEAMVVIGGYHSSNTQKLVAICREEKPDSTFSIETAEELPIDLIKNYETVGVTAGASTPKWIIDEVIEKISSLANN